MKRLLLNLCASFAFMVLPAFSFAQWNCPSLLGQYTKPIASSPFKAGLEVIGSTGLLDENYYGFVSVFGAASYQVKQHTFYVEGGFKGWNRYDDRQGQHFDNSHWGFREAFYQFQDKKLSLRAGIQTMTLSDFYLVNDRALGVNFSYNFPALKLQVAAGSVMKQFSRNGLFCNIGYVYDILHRDRGLMGNGFGEMNFASISATHTFKGNENGLKSIGAVLYDEFGSKDEIKDTNVFSAGLYGTISTPFGLSIMPEIIYQNAKNNNAFLYSLQIRKIFMFENSTRLDCQGRLLASTAIDKDAKIRNSFSNLFLGDVIRLDAPDAPLCQASIRYSIPRYSLHFKLQYTTQLDKSKPLNETDLSVGKRFNHLQISLLGGYIQSQQLKNEDCFLLRAEARFYINPPQNK